MSDSYNRPKPSLGRRLFHFVGSMELAITLLLTLAVASVIGTVLQQNQPYTDYLIKFGPFWFEIFKSIGLYDVYSALWFLAILVLLVVSTSVCLIRHTPSMLKDIWNLRTHVQEKSLAAMHNKRQWLSNDQAENTAAFIQTGLTSAGFRCRLTRYDDQILLSAMRGGLNRLGYILTHAAIVIICVGGLMDSNLPLKVAEWRGKIKIETRDLPLKQIPAASKLAVGPQAFRGSVSIPEGSNSSVTFVAVRDGYLVQQLPFTLEVKDFRIEHYPTGQPKSFETDLVVHDADLAEPKAVTISVNHPLTYKGYSIYQASFADGGSSLDINAWPLNAGAGSKATSIQTKVFESSVMHWGKKSLRLEMTSFRLFNINPDPTKADPQHVRDFGPSIGFKLRSPTGEAKEYVNYMHPVQRRGRPFYLSGVRNSPAEAFGYLYIPVDEQGGLNGFFQLLNGLRDKPLVDKVATQMVNDTLSGAKAADPLLRKNLHATLVTLVDMFVKGGFTEVRRFIHTALPKTEKDTLGPAYLGLLRDMLSRLYFTSKGITNQSAASQAQLAFLQDSVDAIGILPYYGSPVFLKLTSYQHKQASGLQITHSPGKPVVYFGCAFLISGVFLLFYLPQRRFWAWIKAENNQTRVLLAGMSNRNPREFEQYYTQLADQIEHRQREL